MAHAGLTKNNDMKTIDIVVHDLCEEVDYWKELAEKYEALYKEQLTREAEESNRRLKEAQKGVANALMFALSVSDNEDGSLSVSKEDRALLAENYNQ